MRGEHIFVAIKKLVRRSDASPDKSLFRPWPHCRDARRLIMQKAAWPTKGLRLPPKIRRGAAFVVAEDYSPCFAAAPMTRLVDLTYSNTLRSVQATCAVAVIGVLLRHLDWVHNHIHGSANRLSALWLLMGHGVDLFFCISGFIIAAQRRADFQLRHYNYDNYGDGVDAAPTGIEAPRWSLSQPI
jgi:hypothetical protein